jgi:cyanophycinase
MKDLGPLALVGGAEWTDGCTFDGPLLAAAKAKEVVVLTTAAAYENPAKLLARAREWFALLDLEVVDGGVLTRGDASDAKAVKRVRKARALYLSGGSPMHLRSVLKDTPLFDALLEAWHGGALLAGSGAGADVLCDPMVDPRGGAFTVGLGVLPQVSVIPRFDEWSGDKVHRTVALAPADLTVVGLPQRTALILEGGAWRAEGAGEVVAHRAGRRIDLSELPVSLAAP